MHTCLKRKKEKLYRNDNRDPYKEEIKIPPPHPHKRNNINHLPHKENMTDLHVYTYIRTYTKIIHTHTQISNGKKKHKCRQDEPLRCRQTDESLVKASEGMR